MNSILKGQSHVNLRKNYCQIFSSVVDWHLFDADPDPDFQISIIMPIQIRIRIQTGTKKSKKSISLELIPIRIGRIRISKP
jgi:hypothetical protein